MSLSSELQNAKLYPDGPGYCIKYELFPNTRKFILQANKNLNKFIVASLDEFIVPESEYSLEEYTKIGSGIDYAFRCYLLPQSPRNWAAYEGLEMLSGDDWKGTYYFSDEKCDNIIHNSTVLKEYYNNSLCPFIENDPIGQYGDSPQKEEIFFRHCYIAAQMETIFRSGIVPRFVCETKLNNAEEILSSVPNTCVKDMAYIFRSFLKIASSHFADQSKIVTNPKFDGSYIVGGADGDLIYDGCLIEFKTTKDDKLSGQMFHQLLGYYLLDINNSYNINSIGIYSARHATLYKFPIDEIVQFLSDGKYDTAIKAKNYFLQKFAIGSKVKYRLKKIDTVTQVAEQGILWNTS